MGTCTRNQTLPCRRGRTGSDIEGLRSHHAESDGALPDSVAKLHRGGGEVQLDADGLGEGLVGGRDGHTFDRLLGGHLARQGLVAQVVLRLDGELTDGEAEARHGARFLKVVLGRGADVVGEVDGALGREGVALGVEGHLGLDALALEGGGIRVDDLGRFRVESVRRRNKLGHLQADRASREAARLKGLYNIYHTVRNDNNIDNVSISYDTTRLIS